MRIWKGLATAVCVLAALLIFAKATPIQAEEPHYLRALGELRTARDYINFDRRSIGARERHDAVDEINKAIAEIKRAAWDDGKNTQFSEQSQGVQDAWSPLKNSLAWLDQARKHVMLGQDLPQNNGVREHAVEHIDKAKQLVLIVMEYAHQH